MFYLQKAIEIRKFLILAALSVIAGFLNGCLGAAGGIVLYFTLSALYKNDTKKNLMTTAVSVMLFCLISLFFYKGSANLPLDEVIKIALPATLGGAAGALLLKKLPVGAVKRIFSAVLIIGGILMLVRSK